MVIHSYPWYIADWRGSETRIRMTLEERAIYRDLLDHCWEQGSLPNDEQMLAKICSATPSEFKRSWPAVKKSFIEDGDRIRHAKVDAKRPEVIRLTEQRREAGKASAEARAKRASQRSSNERSTSVETSASTLLQPSSTTTSTITSLNTAPPKAAAVRKQFQKPTPSEVEEYGATIGFPVDGEEFCAFYELRGWKPGGSRTVMSDWRPAVVTWKKTWLKKKISQPSMFSNRPTEETTLFVPKPRPAEDDGPDDQPWDLDSMFRAGAPQ